MRKYGRNRCRRGTALTEFAFLLPVLLFLFVVGVDYARVFKASIVVTQCARNGALYASDPNVANSLPFESVEEAALVEAGELESSPTVTTTTGADTSGYTWTEVTVRYPFKTLLTLPGVPNQVDIVRTVRMRNVIAREN
jgi:Flp pilus assembly protein TadG